MALQWNSTDVNRKPSCSEDTRKWSISIEGSCLMQHQHMHHCMMCSLKFSEYENAAFIKSNQDLASAALWAYPVLDTVMYFATDASDSTVCVVLQQQMPDGSTQPLGFFTGRLNESQSKWSLRWRTVDKVRGSSSPQALFGRNRVHYTQQSSRPHQCHRQWQNKGHPQRGTASAISVRVSTTVAICPWIIEHYCRCTVKSSTQWRQLPAHHKPRSEPNETDNSREAEQISGYYGVFTTLCTYCPGCDMVMGATRTVVSGHMWRCNVYVCHIYVTFSIQQYVMMLISYQAHRIVPTW